MTKSNTVLQTENTHTKITDLLLENFDYGEIESDTKKKKYSGPASDHTDTGQDNPYWNLSILLRIGGYCANAQRQLGKANERADKLAEQIANSPSDTLMDALEQNESAIANCEAEYLIFRDFFEDTYGSEWMGEEKYKAQLDEAFSPKTLGSGSTSTARAERAETLLLKTRARQSGRSVDEQGVFEHTMDEFIFDNQGKTLPKGLATIPKTEAQDILNKLIEDSAKSKK